MDDLPPTLRLRCRGVKGRFLMSMAANRAILLCQISSGPIGFACSAAGGHVSAIQKARRKRHETCEPTLLAHPTMQSARKVTLAMSLLSTTWSRCCELRIAAVTKALHKSVRKRHMVIYFSPSTHSATAGTPSLATAPDLCVLHCQGLGCRQAILRAALQNFRCAPCSSTRTDERRACQAAPKRKALAPSPLRQAALKAVARGMKSVCQCCQWEYRQSLSPSGLPGGDKASLLCVSSGQKSCCETTPLACRAIFLAKQFGRAAPFAPSFARTDEHHRQWEWQELTCSRAAVGAQGFLQPLSQLFVLGFFA